MKSQLKEIEENLTEFATRQEDNDYRQGYLDSVKISFKKFQKVSEFYKKYETNYNDLYNEEKKLWNTFVKYHNTYYNCNAIRNLNNKKLWTSKFLLTMVCNDSSSIDFYNTWLFNHCFGGLK